MSAGMSAEDVAQQLERLAALVRANPVVDAEIARDNHAVEVPDGPWLRREWSGFSTFTVRVQVDLRKDDAADHAVQGGAQ